MCESVYKYNEISYEECKLLLSALEKDSKIDSGKDVTQALKYAEYAYNVINIKKTDIRFCRHLFLKEVALALKEAGRYKQAKEVMNIIINVYDEAKEEECNILLELNNNYSKILSREADIKGAMEEALHAEKIIDSVKEGKDSLYSLNRMVIKKTVAMDYAHQKNYKAAFDKIEEAFQEIDGIAENDQYQIANLYSDYARLHLDIGDVQKSIEEYKMALDGYDMRGVPGNSPWRGTTYTNLANAFALNKDYSNANYYAFKGLVGKYSIYKEPNYAIANALLGMGNIYKSEKQLWDVAEVFYRKAIEIFRQGDYPDKYCDTLAGLSVVTRNVEYVLEACEILEQKDRKYDISTYINVMKTVIADRPDKVIKISEKMLNEYSETENLPVLQYVYSLMGKAGYLIQDKEMCTKYLNKMQKMGEAKYFKEEIQEIQNRIPLL